MALLRKRTFSCYRVATTPGTSWKWISPGKTPGKSKISWKTPGNNFLLFELKF